MKITPDFSEAVETNAEIPPGTYKTRVTEVTQQTSKAGNPYLKVKLTIFGAEGTAARYNNWAAYTNLVTSGKGAGKLKDFLSAVKLPVGEFDSEALLGKELVATLVAGKDANGNTSPWPEVKSFKSI